MKKVPTLKQRAFVAEYLKDHNGTQAAKRAGYSMRTAAKQAPQLLAKPGIREAIERGMQRAEERGVATAAQILREMTNLGLSDAGDIVWKPGELDSQGQPTMPGAQKPIYEMPPEVRRCIRSIDVDADGKRRITFWDKNKAHEQLARYHRLFNDNAEGEQRPITIIFERAVIVNQQGKANEAIDG